MNQDRILTLKGKILAGDVIKLTLFDGKFTTAFRILSFTIAPEDILDSETASMKMMTQDETHAVDWNWDLNTEVGWATWSRNTHVVGGYSRVDKEALIVEDLFLDCSADTGEGINYLIELEKVNISDWQGALAIVRNSAQNV